MTSLSRAIRSVLAGALVATTLGAGLPARVAADAQDAWNGYRLDADATGHVLTMGPNGIECIDLPIGAPAFEREESLPMRTITPDVDATRSSKAGSGLVIQLRGTDQLERYPQAKAAFLRAAAEWQDVISTPISVVIDVDFGPKRFGREYDDNVLGSTDSQSMSRAGNYGTIRSAIVARMGTASDAALLGSLPSDAIPTSLGPADIVSAPSILLRALGQLPPTVDPNAPFVLFPSIGFNSAFDFDFDPSDGISPGLMDFHAIVLHEIGHALGFVSNSGDRELSPTASLKLSVWDLYRFRPGTASGAFGIAERVLTSGGSHVFFDGRQELELSTGRADGTGGDSQQPSHWKGNEYTGRLIGIMDPTLASGERVEVTEHDLRALQLMGYSLRGGANAPSVSLLAASLDGDTLTITGTAGDPNSNAVKAQVFLYDAKGASLGRVAELTEGIEARSSFDFSFEIAGLNAKPGAVEVGVALIDGDGNEGLIRRASFLGGDAGAPKLGKAAYKAKKSALKVTGSGFSGAAQLEVNGVIVNQQLKPKKGGTVLKVTGSTTGLGLKSGANRVRVLQDGVRSNIVVVVI